ncbi:MAG: hypothetical protein AAGD11_10445 [Planctomycetota bacterium]
MNGFFAAACLLSVIVACIHTFIGSRTDVEPFLVSSVPEPVKSTLYFCWHITTITLFSIATGFARSSIAVSNRLPATMATVLSLAFCLLGWLIAFLRKRSPVREMPQGFMFGVVAILGVLGLLLA